MMKILFIYRHPSMGFSIGKVFRPIEEEMKKYAEVDSIYTVSYTHLTLPTNREV